jgi:hypothetical protein
LNLQDRRRRLRGKIEAFHKKAEIFWNGVNVGNIEFAPCAKEEEKTEDDWGVLDDDYLSDDGNEEGEDDPDEDDQVQEPESIRLLTPSSLGYAECIKRGKGSLMDQEIQLREGQANDALESLRMALAHKSLLCRKKHQNAKTQRSGTRSQVEIRKAHATVQKHASTYQWAYQALLNLNGAKASFQPLEKKDLTMNSDVVEENRFGQRSDTLAWFWRIGHPTERDKNVDWMQECKCCFNSGCNALIFA